MEDINKDLDNCCTVLPSPKWISELGKEIADEYNLSFLDGICIAGTIEKAMRKNLPKEIFASVMEM